MENNKNKLQLLVVDDCPAFREMLKLLLSKEFTVFEANGANTAKLFIDTLNFDLIISDMEMPDGDGGEVLRFIKASENHSVPLIYFSAVVDLKNTPTLISEGTTFVSKYDPIERLFESIDKVSGTSLLNDYLQR